MMRQPRVPSLVRIAGLFLAATPLSLLASDVVFNFGFSGWRATVAARDGYVSGNTPLARTVISSGMGTAGDPYVYLNAFSDTVPLSPASDYTGPAFYGGYKITSTTLTADSLREHVGRSTRFGDNRNSPVRYLNAIVLSASRAGQDWRGSTVRFVGAIVFRQEDFNEGFTSGPVSIDELKAAVSRWGGMPCSGRWIVKLGEHYYISSTTFDYPPNGIPVSIGGREFVGNTRWARYDPAADLFFDPHQARFEPRSLKNVTAAGIYFVGAVNDADRSTVFYWALGEFSISGSIATIR